MSFGKHLIFFGTKGLGQEISNDLCYYWSAFEIKRNNQH